MVDSGAFKIFRPVQLASASIIYAASKHKYKILIIEPNRRERDLLRSTLAACDYPLLQVCSSHESALKLLNTETYTHLLFSIETKVISPVRFLRRALALSPNIICIVSLPIRQIEQAFELQQSGLKGFVTKPYNMENLDQTIKYASDGYSGFNKQLNDDDRNYSLAVLLASYLDEYARVRKLMNSGTIGTAEITNALARLRNLHNIARKLAHGGAEGLLLCIVKIFTEQCAQSPERLAELKEQLEKKRGAKFTS